MFTDILKKYMNIFIIILYVYILYSYDFKDNIQLLLIITGIFIYIIYKNKYNVFTNDIIEGQTDGDGTTGGADDTTTGGADDTTTGGADDTTTGGADDTTTGGADDTTTGGADDELYVVDGASRRRLREMLNELRNEIESLDDETGIDQNNPKINELINLYLEVYPDLEINLPNTPGGIDLGDLLKSSLNLNLDLGGIESINIPSDMVDSYNNNELPKLKKRIKFLEEKVKELDEEDNVQMLKEKVMDLEIENDKWNQKGSEEDKGDGTGLKQRKARSFSNYKTTTPMGMYDGMCLDHLKKENIYNLANEDDVNTFLGTTLPLKLKKVDNSKLNGPTVDGNDSSPKRLNMFETNKTSISCCEDSPYLSSNGCVCLTSDQEDYLVNRGGNHD